MAENMRPPADQRLSVRRRGAGWLAWWVLMMSLWVIIDDSLQFDELLAGAGAAALAALGAELATYQASVRFRPTRRPGGRPGLAGRGETAAQALRVPGRVVSDTLTVFGALARTLVTGRPPDGGFAEVPVAVPPTEAGRVLLTGLLSVAPNTFVLGLDDERGVAVVHRLAPPGADR